MKKYLGLFVTIITLLMTNTVVLAAEVPAHSENFYINDFAEVFTDEQENEILSSSLKLAEEYDGVQIVVTTIESTNGEDIDDYATNMYNSYKIGKDSKGVLILVATKDRNVVIRTGDNFSSVISDSKAKSILNNYGIPKLKNNDFAGGILAMYDAIYDRVIDYYKPVDNTIKNEVTVPNRQPQKESSDSKIGYIIGMVILGFCWVVNVLIVYFSNKLKQKEIECNNSELILRKDAIIRDLKEEINKKNTQLSGKNGEIDDKNKIISQYREKMDIAEKLYPNILREIDEHIKINDFMEEKRRLLDKYNKLKSFSASSILTMDENECTDYISLRKSFNDDLDYFKNHSYSKLEKIAKETGDVLILFAEENMTSFFDDLVVKARERLIEIENYKNEQAARKLEEVLLNAKRRRSKYACKDAIREYERTSKDILFFLAPMYIHMYNDMKDAVKHPTHNNDFFPVEPDHSTSNDNNGYSSSFDSFGGFGGFSSGGGASGSF